MRASRRTLVGLLSTARVAGFLLCGLLLSGGAAASDKPAEWLERMAEAMRTRDYAGTLVYEHGNRLESMEVVHGLIDGTEYERMTVLNGDPFEVIRRGNKVICVWPAKRKALVDRRPGGLLAPRPPRELETVPEHYRATLGEQARIADRQARVLRLDGSDRYRYDYRMWIDTETDLLLRSELVDHDGMVYERFMFTDLQLLDTIRADRFEPSLEDMQYQRHGSADPETSTLEHPRWEVADLPPGFHLVSHRSEAMPPHGNAVQHSVYSDGLASVSVFIESANSGDMPLNGLSRMGAVHAFGRQLEGRQVTVVGEVPAATVRRIASSVQQRSQ